MTKEVFLVEDGGRSVVFAPLKGLILELISDDEKERVIRTIDQPDFSLGDLLAIFPEVEEGRLFTEGNDGKDPVVEEGFCPDSAVLFPTFGCHLRCTYCYARGGDQTLGMDRELIRAVADFVVANAERNRHGKCSIELHGGGEPTWDWSAFKFAVERFQQKAHDRGLEAVTSLVTNGILSRQRVDWIKEHVQEIQVSLDGMAEIQNAQRPTASGKGSFTTVARTVSALLAGGSQVRIHSVITEQSMNRMPEIIRFFAEQFPGASVQLEPVFPTGRALSTNQHFPSIDLFVEGFIEAHEVGRSMGMEVLYSGARPNLTVVSENFCGVNEPNFIVTPAGYVTACTEAADMTHQFARYFIYGHYDRDAGKFQFDDRKIAWLRSSRAVDQPTCQECFARYYCAGECMAYNLDTDGEQKPDLMNPRCTVNRRIMKNFVFSQLETERR